MKKTKFAFFVGIAGALLFTTSAIAATTFSFSPANISVKEGQEITLSVAVDPHGVKNYTVKTELNYPADLLEARSFSFESGWLAVSRTGYDVMDNSNGLLIKTAGYPGGISTAAPFGSVSFVAKKSGSGAVNIGSNSLVLDATSQNVLDSAQTKVLVVIAPVTAIQTQKSLPVSEQVLLQAPTTPEQAQEVIGQTEPLLIAQSGISSSTLLASALNTLAFGTGKTWVSILTLVILAIIIILAIYFLARKPRDNKQ